MATGVIGYPGPGSIKIDSIAWMVFFYLAFTKITFNIRCLFEISFLTSSYFSAHVKTTSSKPFMSKSVVSMLKKTYTLSSLSMLFVHFEKYNHAPWILTRTFLAVAPMSSSFCKSTLWGVTAGKGETLCCNLTPRKQRWSLSEKRQIDFLNWRDETAENISDFRIHVLWIKNLNSRFTSLSSRKMASDCKALFMN